MNSSSLNVSYNSFGLERFWGLSLLIWLHSLLLVFM